ncbi:MAG: AsnC family transcriptional regulator [Synergistaceae bacterium]|nr:AsnC family transcriptional regulator [Synergistaceae bacterium]
MRAEKALDKIGVKILEIIQNNARISYSGLGCMIGLSPPAAAARVRQLEEQGHIREYRACVAGEKLGLPYSAFISVSPNAGHRGYIDDIAQRTPEIIEEHHLTSMGEDGCDGIIMKVMFSSMSHLESIIDKIAAHGETSTSIILSSSVSNRALGVRVPDEV